MKKIIFILTLLVSLVSFTQDWQYIGGEGALGSASEIATAKGANNQIYVAKRNGTTISIHTWNGSNWNQVGTNFSTSGSNVQLGIKSGGVPVIAFYQTSQIKVYEYSGGSWTNMVPSGYSLTSPSDREFKLYIEGSSDIRMTFNNQNPIIGATELITTYVGPSTVTAVGSEIDANDDPHFKNVDFLLDDTDEDWVFYDYFGLSEGASLVHRNGASWDSYNASSSRSEDIKFLESDNYFTCFYRNNGSSIVTWNVFNKTSLTFGGEANVINADQDFAVANRDDHTLIFSRSNSSNYAIREINGYATINNWSNFGPSGSISQLELQSYSNYSTGIYFPIAAFIHNGQVSVMELSMPATFNYTTEEFCVGNSITTSNISVNDPNYDNSNSTTSVAISGASPLSNPTIGGSYPNYTVSFDVDMSSSTDGVYSFDFNYDNDASTTQTGDAEQLSTFQVALKQNPEITFSFPDNTFCSADNPVFLNNHVSPVGGTWELGAGMILTNNVLDFSTISAGNHTLTYTYTGPNGCTNFEDFNFDLFSSPILSVSSTETSCGDDDGTATVNVAVSNGDSYSIYWSNGDTESMADSLEPGMYYTNVTTENGCIAIAPVSIENTDLTLSGTETPATCFGEPSGSIDMTVSGSGGNYNILWSNGETTEDIDNLMAGPYTVTVEDENGCTASRPFIVGEPDEITWTAGTNQSSCAGGDGLAFCNVVGGTAPYDFQWLNSDGNPVGVNNDTLENISGGFYQVVIIDAAGCSTNWNTTVSEIGGPVVTIDNVQQASCSDDGAINTTIDAPNGIQEIGWNSGENTEDLTDLAPGYYAIWVVDNLGCTGMASATIDAIVPDPVDICLVTVDESTTTNKIVWQKPVSTSISKFKIYRETSQAGLFQVVDSVLYSEESEFTDPVASPQVRSWRYKLTSVDLCGRESEMSDFHKTIHLTISQGLGSNINLHWDHYEGLSYSTYDIWRNDDVNGWQEISNLPISSTSYTDMPTETNGLDYMVVIDPPGVCTSEKANDYNTSRSNRSAGAFNPTSIDENILSTLDIFPNPSTGNFRLELEESGKKEISIVSSNGKIIYSHSTSKNQIDFQLTNVEAGVYYMIIKTGNKNRMEKLIIK